MIRVLAYTVIILLGLIVSPFLSGSNGYLLFAIGDYEVETSIAFAVLALIVFYSLLQLAEWGVVFIINLLLNSRLLPEKWRKKAAKKHTFVGALALAEEDWQGAEKAMLKGADKGEIPTLNLLAAARAAHHQSGFEKRDEYLELAQAEPLARTAIATTRTRYLMQQGLLTEAREQLDKLAPTSKSKLPVLKLAMDLYQAQQDWAALKLIMPTIQKRALLDVKQLEELTHTVNHTLLDSASQDNEQALEKVWHWLSRTERKQADYLAAYCMGLTRFERKDEAVKLLMKSIKTQVTSHVATALIKVLSPSDVDTRKQLFNLESKWGKEKDFQILIAQLHQQNKDYRQASTYWSAVCLSHPTKESHLALAKVYEHLGEQNNALTHYKKSLQIG